jgi:hypothetical protein
MRPLSVTIVSIVFILVGFYAIYDSVVSFAHSRYVPNLLFFWLPIGIGLFLGKASSRRWAKGWIILFWVLLVAAFVAGVMGYGRVSVRWHGQPLTGTPALLVEASLVGFFAGLLFLVFWGLSTSKADLFFRER